MTTAHRPTFNPAKGGNNQGGNKLYYPSQQFSAKDVPTNLNIKQRQIGQGTIREVQKRDFKKELIERERKAKLEGKASSSGLINSLYGDLDEDTLEIENINSKVDITSDLLEAPKKKQRLDDEDGETRTNIVYENVFLHDKDLSFSESEDINKENDSFDEEEDDEEEELLRELEKIKHERELENQKKEQELAEIKRREQQEQTLKGNPLLNNYDYSLKKKWYEDTVFKNQSKNEPKIKKRFINDSVRSDFHRKFMSKTIL